MVVFGLVKSEMQENCQGMRYFGLPRLYIFINNNKVDETNIESNLSLQAQPQVLDKSRNCVRHFKPFMAIGAVRYARGVKDENGGVVDIILLATLPYPYMHADDLGQKMRG